MSRKTLCSNDEIIKQMAVDDNYCIKPDGTIWTRLHQRGLGVTNQWRQCGHIHARHAKKYFRMRYKNKHVFVHRVVYQAHIGELDEALTINHKDGNGLNNHVTNLELVTQAENNLKAFRETGKKPVVGYSKIDQKTAKNIRALKAAGWSLDRIRKRYGLAKSTVSYVVNKRTWKDAS